MKSVIYWNQEEPTVTFEDRTQLRLGTFLNTVADEIDELKVGLEELFDMIQENVTKGICPICGSTDEDQDDVDVEP